jgi:hypothetical protein
MLGSITDSPEALERPEGVEVAKAVGQNAVAVEVGRIGVDRAYND